MKTIGKKNLFWFLKEGTKLDLSNKTHLDMYIQQTLMRGKTSDVRDLLKKVRLLDLIESFHRIKDFLPQEVKKFWEEGLGNINKSTKKDT